MLRGMTERMQEEDCKCLTALRSQLMQQGIEGLLQVKLATPLLIIGGHHGAPLPVQVVSTT